MKIPKWSDYQETPINFNGLPKLEEADKLSLLQKLGLSASTEKARSDFLHSRRLKG